MVLLSLLSIVTMTADHRLRYLDTVRMYLGSFAAPLYYLVDWPISSARELTSLLRTRDDLQGENERLRLENLRLTIQQQRMADLRAENQRLRQLLHSTPRIEREVMIADVLAVDLNPFARKLVINKGSRDGVESGLPLLDTQGVLGQVLHVNAFSSSVILITDPNHIIPVQVVRNGLHAFAEGMGANNLLSLLYLPNTAEVQVGDEVVTSGLGGKFPPGYPVGTVSKALPQSGQSYMQVEIVPSALLHRNREILLVWPDEAAHVAEEAEAQLQQEGSR